MPGPLHDVMCIRRHQPTRLEGFVDASFAFAVTLVIISIGHVPSSVEEMLRALHGLPTFAACFLLLARIWFAHREWSRHYDLDDRAAIVLSLALVFVILVYVYPLRMLIAQAFLGLSHGWLDDGSIKMLGTLDELRAAYLVFGLGLAAISAIFVRLFVHALRNKGAIGLGAGEVLYTRMKMRIWIAQLFLCLLSIALALTMWSAEPWVLSLPGVVYVLNGIFGRIARTRCARALTRSAAAS